MTEPTRPDRPDPDESAPGGTPESGSTPEGAQGDGPGVPPPGAGRRTGRIGGDLQNPRNRLGVLSVIAGLLTLVCECLPFVSIAFGVAAIVLGFMHNQRVRAGTASAPNLALVGIVLGVIGIVLSICFGVSSIGDRLRHDVYMG